MVLEQEIRQRGPADRLCIKTVKEIEQGGCYGSWLMEEPDKVTNDG